MFYSSNNNSQDQISTVLVTIPITEYWKVKSWDDAASVESYAKTMIDQRKHFLSFDSTDHKFKKDALKNVNFLDTEAAHLF